MMLHLRSLAVFVLFVSVSCAAEDFTTLADAKECFPRAGLPNFFNKVRQSKADVRVGYLGGSITAQPGWRVKTLAHFQQVWPQVRFSEMNAAIGGTGSDLGVFRVGQDVLAHKPDLLFIEFAVNDGGADPVQIIRCMEGIVRQTWLALPECDICFVYTLTQALSPPMMEGKFQRSATAMEKVADHYGIPTIHMGMEVAKLAKAGKLEWKAKLPSNEEEKQAMADRFVFAPDGVHPHPETGHQLYFEAVVRSMESMVSLGAEPHSHPLAKPLNPQNYEKARMIPIHRARISSGIHALDPAKDAFAKRWAARLPDLHVGSKPGETVRFQFRGTRCALYDIVGPDAGQVIVKVDDLPARIVPRFDSYCTYHRLGTMLVAEALPDAVHSVEITIHPDQPDKAAILAKRGQKIDAVERFRGTNFYPGAMLILGELVEE